MYYEELDINIIELDLENPRIKHYLQMYKEITSETISLALSGSSNNSAAGKYHALRESIKENGGIFTPIIVNHIVSTDRYVVIEGNTRLKFYKEFNEKEPDGKWQKIISIVYDDMPEDQIHAIRLQAHMVGARDWDAYSKAKYLNYLYNVEKKSMKYLKAFCGGQESNIRQLIEAYNDMINYYESYCKKEEMEFDPQKFSYYVELQKSGAKESLSVHGYDIFDFTKWVLNENLDRAESVRKLARVLGEESAKKEFLKNNMTSAIKKLDSSEADMKRLEKSNLYDMAKEVAIKVRNISYSEVKYLKENKKGIQKREILEDLKYELDNLLKEFNDED